MRCARQAVRDNSVVCEDVLGEACTAVGVGEVAQLLIHQLLRDKSYM